MLEVKYARKFAHVNSCCAKIRAISNKKNSKGIVALPIYSNLFRFADFLRLLCGFGGIDCKSIRRLKQADTKNYRTPPTERGNKGPTSFVKNRTVGDLL
jgi:hypothetical protein